MIEYYPEDEKIEYDFISTGCSDLKYTLCEVKHLEVFTLVKDWGIGVASYDECMAMVEDGYIEHSEYWFPRKGQYAILMRKDMFKYSKTIEKMRTALSDFRAGYRAALEG